MSVRCTITMLGPVHIWEDVRDGVIYVQDSSINVYPIDKEELVNAVNDILTCLGKDSLQTHSGDENE